eukprot:g2352.t1
MTMNEEDQQLFRSRIEDEMLSLQNALLSGEVKPAATAIRIKKSSPADNTTEKVSNQTLPPPKIMGEVMERSVSSSCPPPEASSSNFNAFPTAVHRAEVNLSRRRAPVDLSVDGMSKKAILKAQNEIKAKLKPKTVEFLKERALRKRSDYRIRPVIGFVNRLRFSFEAEVVDLVTKEELRNSQGVEQMALKRDPVMPSQSYSLSEMVVLTMSSFLTHRTAGLQILKNTVLKSKTCSSEKVTIPVRLTEGEEMIEDVVWKDIWSCLVHDLDCCSLLRMLLRDRSQSIVHSAVQVLDIISSLPEAESLWTDLRVMHPSTAWPSLDSIPLQRGGSYDIWQKSELQDNVLTLLQLLHRQMESGIVDDLLHGMQSFPIREIQSPVLSILTLLGSLSQKSCQEIISNSKILVLLKELLEQDLEEVQLMVLRLLSKLLEKNPGSCARHLSSHGILDLIRSHLSSSGVHQDPPEELLVILFRIWRHCCTENMCFVSLDDLFASFESYLEPPLNFDKLSLKLSQEIYLCLASAVENVQNCRICPLSKQCASVLVPTTVHWLRVEIQEPVQLKSQEIQLRFFDCLSAVLLFLDLCFQHGLSPGMDQQQLRTAVESLRRMKTGLQKYQEATDEKQDCRIQQIIWIHFWSCLHQLMDTLKLDFKSDFNWQFNEHINSRSIVSLKNFEDLNDMQYRTHWCNFSLHYLARNLDHPVQALSWNLELLTQLPPGLESKAVTSLENTLTPETINILLDKTPRVLGEFQDSRPFQDPVKICSILFKALVYTWCGEKKATKLPQNRIKMGTSFMDLNSVLQSRFPLGKEYLFLPFKSGTEDDLQVLLCHLWLLVGLEMSPSSWLTSLNPFCKMKLLIELVFLTNRQEQRWENNFVVNAVRQLLKMYVSKEVAIVDNCSTVSWESEFVENLVTQYCLVSCGDAFFGEVVTLLFLTGTSMENKSLAWKILEENKLLHAVPAMESWIGGVNAYNPDPIQTQELRLMINASRKRGSLLKSQRLHSGITQWIQMHFNDVS